MEPDLGYFNDKRILITGGGGYLGSKFAVFLASTDAEIFLLDITFNVIAESLVEEKSNVFKLVVDLTNQQGADEAINISQPDLIFHFAALLNRERDFSKYRALYRVNVEGTLHLLESLKQVNYTGLYFASSSEVYGNTNPSPFREDQNPMPASPYSLTKLMAENLISTYSQICNKPFTILRLFNFYGPQMPGDFFLSQLEYSLNNNIPFEMTYGEQKRDFIYINDLITLIAHVAMRTQSIGQIINVCSGNAASIKELAERTAVEMNKKHLLRVGAKPYRKNEIWEMVGDNTKIKTILGNIMK